MSATQVVLYNGRKTVVVVVVIVVGLVVIATSNRPYMKHFVTIRDCIHYILIMILLLKTVHTFCLSRIFMA